jgi:hypothetical protein
MQRQQRTKGDRVQFGGTDEEYAKTAPKRRTEKNGNIENICVSAETRVSPARPAQGTRPVTPFLSP